jgi:predicted nucleic acid-binding Zn ribbon protein
LEEVGKILPVILGRRLRPREPALIDVLAPFWPRIAGKPIAQHTRLAAFHEGVLTLVTTCPSWAEQLRHMAEEIRSGINSFWGKPVVKKLHIRRVETLEPPHRKTPRELALSAGDGNAGEKLDS